MPTALLAVPEYAIVLLHVVVLGGCGLRWARYAPADRWAWVALVGAVGFAAFGAELFVLGEARLLARPTVYLSCGLMAVLAVWQRPLGSFPGRIADVDDGETSGQRWATVALSLAGAALIASALFYPPKREDEVEYHWPTPLLWAAQHGWVASPYRLSNGPALAEMIYTVPALFGNPTAAHFTAATYALVAAAAVGALARAVGAPAWTAVAAAASIPAFVVDAPHSLNDNTVAAFLLAAYVPILTRPWPTPSRSAVAVTTALIVAAISTKPFAVIPAVPLIGYLCVRGWQTPADRRRLLAGAAALSVAVVVTFAVWSLHCRLRTGHWWETNGVYLARSPADPMWNSEHAAGRHPRLIDRLTTPFIVTFYPTVGPERGRYGVRTGAVAVLFGAMAIPGWRRLTRDGRGRLGWLLGSAGFFLVVFSPTSPKTRFFLFTWLALCVAAAVGLRWAGQASRRPVVGRLALAAFVALVAVFEADSANRMHNVHRLMAQVRSAVRHDPAGSARGR